MPDWIDDFLDNTNGIASPEIFRLWAGISALAGLLERRIWMVTSSTLPVVYPNLFVLLVAPPAVGKSLVLSKVKEVWKGTKKLHVAPNSMTKAHLLDTLEQAARKLPINNGQSLMEYSALNIASSEFGVLVPSHDTEFLNVLNDIFDNPDDFREGRRHSKSVEIKAPLLNIIAGTQPGFLAVLLPEEAWSMGFMSRVVMVYANSGPKVQLFSESLPDQVQIASLIQRAAKLTSLIGEMQTTPAYRKELIRWSNESLEPVPEHSKLVHYNGRRILMIIKLSIISAVSRSSQLVCDLCDLTRARNWLLQVEQVMPDVFREMVGRSDSQVIQELHFHVWSLWLKDKRPIHESRLFSFLKNRVPSEKVEKILHIAVKSDIIKSDGMMGYIPRPKHEHGTE